MPDLQDRRDTEFLLYDVLGVDHLHDFPRFREHSRDTYDLLFDLADRLAEEELRPTNTEGDRHGTVFDDGRVLLPESFRPAIEQLREVGYLSLNDDEEVGGQQIPHAIGTFVTSVLYSANQALMMLPALTHGAAKLVELFGTERQRALYLQPLLAFRFGGTMCLTEAGAGSDVGASVATARRMDDGTYRIKGTKIFISWGDHEMTENIVYPVLARIEGDPAGTKGITLFLVPKFHVNEDGTLGERNDVACSGVEHKMGIHASPTCTIVFGEDRDDCEGELLGEEREGMRAMFVMMNGARIGTGVQGLAQAELAYRYALEYALDRRQGSSLADFKNPEAERVPIVHHPDVRRMLMDMKVKVEGIRALIGFTALQFDVARAAEGEEAEVARGLVELLTPVVKAWCTDVGFDVTESAMQVLGGHGYLTDHPVEQAMRDVKIRSLYEGTNGIQAMDLVGRKLHTAGGQAFAGLLARIEETGTRLTDHPQLGRAADRTVEAARGLGSAAASLAERFGKGDLEAPLLNAKPFLDAMGTVVVAWLLLWEAEVAAEKLGAGGEGPDGDFLRSKVLGALYFGGRVVPGASAALAALEENERAALDVVFDGER